MNIEILFGEILTKVWINEDKDRVFFLTNKGKTYCLSHCQDCCESVYIESITGDLENLIGSPILIVEESTSNENPEDVKIEYQDCFTWTFYKLATIKGYVDIRFYGESNGYYSERVDFMELQ